LDNVCDTQTDGDIKYVQTLGGRLVSIDSPDGMFYLLDASGPIVIAMINASGTATRYYDPTYGQFGQADPLGSVGLLS
jgi:hypothetical protein